MSTTQQPEALRLADWVESVVGGPHAKQCAAELRRLHASWRAERERNLDSIHVSNAIINKKNDELESLRTGYAAARLEIESLRARSAEPVGEYPALPALFREALAWGMTYGPEIPAYQWDEMRESMVKQYADRAMRAAQPAGAQQTGAAYAALPMSTAMHAIDGVTACWNSDQMKAFADATCALRATPAQFARGFEAAKSQFASHGQAPAQAAPAAVAGPGERIVAWRVTIPNVFQGSAFRGVWLDGAPSQAQLDLYAKNAPRSVIELAYAAPTTQPAPQQEAQEPVAWYVTGCGRLLDEYEAEAEARRIGGTAKAMPLYTVPQPSPASQVDALDAARYRWLRHGDNDEKVLKAYTSRPSEPGDPTMFLPRTEELDRLIDAARAAQEGKSHV